MSNLEKFSSLTGHDKQPEGHIELALTNGSDPTKDPLEKAYERPLPPVDGGTKAWSAVAGGFLALFVQFGLGKFQEPPKTYTSHQLVGHLRSTLDLILGQRPVSHTCPGRCPVIRCIAVTARHSRASIVPFNTRYSPLHHGAPWQLILCKTVQKRFPGSACRSLTDSPLHREQLWGFSTICLCYF